MTLCTQINRSLDTWTLKSFLKSQKVHYWTFLTFWAAKYYFLINHFLIKKLFLIFRDFKPQYAYQLFSYKKRVHLKNFFLTRGACDKLFVYVKLEPGGLYKYQLKCLSNCSRDAMSKCKREKNNLIKHEKCQMNLRLLFSSRPFIPFLCEKRCDIL